jgi:hypothetical protein
MLSALAISYPATSFAGFVAMMIYFGSLDLPTLLGTISSREVLALLVVSFSIRN